MFVEEKKVKTYPEWIQKREGFEKAQFLQVAPGSIRFHLGKKAREGSSM